MNFTILNSIITYKNVNIIYLYKMSFDSILKSKPSEFLQRFNKSKDGVNTISDVSNKRAFESISESDSDSDSDTDIHFNTKPVLKKLKNEESKTYLYNYDNLRYIQKIYSKSNLVKQIKNPYFINSLIKFATKYHCLQTNPFGLNPQTYEITNTSFEFLQLIADYRMAYYFDNRTNDELWTEFTKFNVEIEYKN